MPPNLYLSPMLPNHDPSGDCGQATYSREVHLWDKAAGNAADFTAQFVFGMESQNRNTSGDRLAFFDAPPGSAVSCDLGGECRGLPKGSFVANRVDTFKNPWDGDVPHVGIDLNNIRSAANVTVTWLNGTMDGRLVNASITYDSKAKNWSVILVDANGNSNNSVSLHYAPLDLSEYLPEWVDVGFSAATGAAYEFHMVHSWEFSSSLRLWPEKTALSLLQWLLIAIGSIGILAVIILASFAWVRYRPKGNRPYPISDLPEGDNGPKTTKGNGSRPGEVEEAGHRSVKLTEELENFCGPKKFSYEELTTATDSFAQGRILGKGGFGMVYEGHIRDGRTRIAVKIIKPNSHQGKKEYVSEVMSLSQLRHKNLVQLIGYCHEADNLALVYEFMRGGSLEDHLFNSRTLLTWERRYNIAWGLASGLHYLHEQCNQCVIHRDIKSSNTMLDEKLNAKLGDFGLARLVDHARGPDTTELIGTPGYLAPECYQTGKGTKESDIYGFGVVLLEIVCGKRVFDSELAEQSLGLVQWVWKLYGWRSWSRTRRWHRNFLGAVDKRLGKDFDGKQAEALMIVGLWCAHPVAASRPSVEAAMSVLDLKAEPPKLPSKMPVFNI
ncbi:L-type lectin-domain containing receptor kinase IX.1-like [Rhodamnia argentea]|uniref:L-type lectin-domain containing receptor kinase IX.1-like n=1 Tax=Rhodamnia argentea TaxID=178133 RepID=A0ABM3H4Y8_9MYRT|nr:L-type lectin-domain containing receptor kinase IX.1-like [Rhodamnia argentea]